LKSVNNTHLIAAFIVAVLLFGGGPITAGIINGGMNGNRWIAERSWMRTPALFALDLGIVLGWVIFEP